jgi:hypothetical protein
LDFVHVAADDLQRLAEKRLHRTAREMVTPFRLQYVLAVGVVTAGKGFSDHNFSICSMLQTLMPQWSARISAPPPHSSLTATESRLLLFHRQSGAGQ